jgi:4,5-dihydroxyphthalate decarboxylase
MMELRYDVGEMSIAAYTKARELGLPLRALPVFTSGRRFVQAGIYVSRTSGLTSADQLVGRSIGLPQYWISSCVWQRHVLERMHGVAPASARWVSIQPERFEADLPVGVDLRFVEGGDFATLLREGKVDGLILQGGQPLPPDLADLTVPAYPDLLAAERDYFTVDGVLPLMHLPVIQTSVIDQSPDIVPALLDAYAEAKKIALADPATSWPIPPLGHGLQPMRDLVGDPWPYGVSANRAALETFLNAAASQGLVRRRYNVDELFVDDLPAEYV